jgi:transposase
MVDKDSFARVVDEFVGNMDTSYFCRAEIKDTGRPPYDPKDLLKLYIYGMENGIVSSRKLERESRRNIELMWLLNELVPESKTICNFRKDNADNLVRFFREFCYTLKENGYIDGKLMALDGTKIRANNSRKNNYTLRKVEFQIGRIEDEMSSYLRELGNNDQAEEKLERLNERKEKYVALKRQMLDSDVNEISTTDKDARLMPANNSGMDVAYNVQSVVDAKHKLIAGMEVVCSAAETVCLVRSRRKSKRN